MEFEPGNRVVDLNNLERSRVVRDRAGFVNTIGRHGKRCTLPKRRVVELEILDCCRHCQRGGLRCWWNKFTGVGLKKKEGRVVYCERYKYDWEEC